MQELGNSSYKLPENIVTVIENCLTKEQCRKLIKYHKINFNLVTFDDAPEQYNGRRIPYVNIFAISKSKESLQSINTKQYQKSGKSMVKEHIQNNQNLCGGYSR